MENIRNLLSQIKIITNKNAEILDATGARFNMFKICGVNHYENTHSAILAELLQPNGTHGLKSKLLERFVTLFGNDDLKHNFNYEEALVTTEYTTEYGRIDILIEDNQNNAIIIENKIYAVDQWEQLKRYDKYACKKYDNYQIFYLTLWGGEASEQSGKDVNYTCLSYKCQIIEWLEQCVPIAVHFPMVRETLNQYINHLKTLTNQDMDAKNKEELIDLILSNENNFVSYNTLLQNQNDVIKRLVEDSIKIFEEKVIKVVALNNSLKYEIDVEGGNVRFYDQGLLKDLSIDIEFQESNLRLPAIASTVSNIDKNEKHEKLASHLLNVFNNSYPEPLHPRFIFSLYTKSDDMKIINNIELKMLKFNNTVIPQLVESLDNIIKRILKVVEVEYL